ncbi:MAG: hypothetical protein Ta2G_18510 [Termitinemataceae bacterium]|nr:MAG: hypothetical protein Ta2G_18510 [Termitinemataceae bacterium]
MIDMRIPRSGIAPSVHTVASNTAKSDKKTKVKLRNGNHTIKITTMITIGINERKSLPIDSLIVPLITGIPVT